MVRKAEDTQVADRAQQRRAQTARQLLEAARAVRASVVDPVDQARTRTLTFFRFASDNRELFRIVFGHGASFHDVVRRCQDSFINDMRESLAGGMASGA